MRWFVVVVVFSLPVLQDPSHLLPVRREQQIEQVYEIYDPYYCFLTPRPFICRKCLNKNQRLVRITTFGKNGKPFRSYVCKPWEQKYLN